MAAVSRAVRGFRLYGLANAAFVTTCVGALAGPYLTGITRDDVGGSRATALALGPVHVPAEALYAYVVAAATVVQVLVLPPLTARGDRAPRRPLLAVTTAVGVVATVLLLVVPPRQYAAALLDYAVALVAFGAAQAVYNAMLVDVAAAEDRDAVSAGAYAVSYLGGGALLLLNLLLVSLHGPLGLSKAAAVRVCLASAGVWWGAFGWAALRRLPLRAPGRPGAGTLAQLREVRRVLAVLPGTRRFLVAYLFFNDAIQTTVGLASTVITYEVFGGSTDRAAGTLLVLLLMIQLVAAPGAAASARLAARFGAQRTLEALLAGWVVIVAASYLMVRSLPLVFVLGIAIALVLGGSGSLTRSLFSRLVPPGQESVFFGVYQLAERGTAWLAAVLFGVVVTLTGSYRGAILSLVLLFGLGLALLRRCDVDAAAAEAAALDPAALAA